MWGSKKVMYYNVDDDDDGGGDDEDDDDDASCKFVRACAIEIFGYRFEESQLWGNSFGQHLSGAAFGSNFGVQLSGDALHNRFAELQPWGNSFGEQLWEQRRVTALRSSFGQLSGPALR